MKPVLVALIFITALPSVPAAQTPGGRIAYDYCYNLWFIEDYETRCEVHVIDPGVGSGLVSSGLDPALSPDGRRVAFVWDAGITIVNLQDGTRTILTNDGAAPTWSSDGQRIAFESARGGTLELYVMNVAGTGVTQVTNGVGFRGRPSWSPDDRIAFDCVVDQANGDLCSINSDGTGFARLTNFEGYETAPAFSPDGTRIAFASSLGLAILNGDGSVSYLGRSADVPAWSPDGSRLAFHNEGGACQADGRICYGDISTVNTDGTGRASLTPGSNPSWALSPVGSPPSPHFSAVCTALTCIFDASQSQDDESIVSFDWKFGDGATGTGSIPVHTYAAAGSYAVELTVVDNRGARGSLTQTVNATDRVNSPPVASVQVSCNGLTCNFDGSGSSDPDGTIASYIWKFGDAAEGVGSKVTHTYAATGMYSVVLTVTDNVGDTGTRAATVTVVQPTVHIGDLDGATAQTRSAWTATVSITVHDYSHGLLANAAVNGSWNDGSAASCTTNASGLCAVARTGIPKGTTNVSFTITSVARATFAYARATNHDPDGDSNGTVITVTRR